MGITPFRVAALVAPPPVLAACGTAAVPVSAAGTAAPSGAAVLAGQEAGAGGGAG